MLGEDSNWGNFTCIGPCRKRSFNPDCSWQAGHLSNSPSCSVLDPAELEIVGVILTRNEASEVAACIASLQQFLTKVLVLDSGSTDHTREIAKECGAMVVIRPFTDFASQRQAALDLVDRKWVLFVDADERIPEDLAMEIATFCRGDGETRAWAGANMPRRNHIVDGIPQWGGFSPDRQLRLLRPECSSYAKSPPVHEYPFIEGPIYEFQTPMIHFNYRSWKQFHAKQRHYAELDAHNADRDMVLPLLSMCRRFLRLFYYRYWQLAGWKDGWLGFKLALLLAWYYGPLPIAVALFSEPANPSS